MDIDTPGNARTPDEAHWSDEILPNNAVNRWEGYLEFMGHDHLVTEQRLRLGEGYIYNFLTAGDVPSCVDMHFADGPLFKDLESSVDFGALVCDHESTWQVILSRDFARQRLCFPEFWPIGRPLSIEWMRRFLPRSYALLPDLTQATIDQSWSQKGFYYQLQAGLTGMVLSMTVEFANEIIGDETFDDYEQMEPHRVDVYESDAEYDLVTLRSST